MSKIHDKVWRPLNYFEHFLVFVSAVNVCVSISEFVSVIGVPVGITGSAIEMRICSITIGIKKYNSIIIKEEKA